MRDGEVSMLARDIKNEQCRRFVEVLLRIGACVVVLRTVDFGANFGHGPFGVRVFRTRTMYVLYVCTYETYDVTPGGKLPQSPSEVFWFFLDFGYFALCHLLAFACCCRRHTTALLDSRCFN